MDIFGIPVQAFAGQLLIGLINGSFYALLSLGQLEEAAEALQLSRARGGEPEEERRTLEERLASALETALDGGGDLAQGDRADVAGKTADTEHPVLRRVKTRYRIGTPARLLRRRQQVEKPLGLRPARRQTAPGRFGRLPTAPGERVPSRPACA